jgi:hypothetical protein
VPEETLDRVLTAFDSDSAFDMYVFSCAEHDEEIGDDRLLSMWRGYGGDGNGSGVAIVFDMDPLLVARSPLLVHQVQYLSYEASEAWMEQKLQQPLALRSVVRMLELYQPAWTDRVARSSTPYRSQR